MSAQLDKAKEQVAAGKLKAALDTLRYAEVVARSGDLDEARGIIELLDVISDSGDRRLQGECQELSDAMHDVIELEAGIVKQLRQVAIVFLDRCKVIGGAGLPVVPDPERPWILAFTEDRVVLLPHDRPQPDETFDLGWDGLSVDVEGAGAFRKGGGFIGGGFGLVGAAAGMLAAGVLNSMTTTTGIDTVVHLQTLTVELYLYYGSAVPVALRRTLAPVFLKLRQATPSEPVNDEALAADHVVDRLHKLGDLLDRGLIDEAEFAKLKADLMREVR